jgi:hypothetical protein
MLRVSMTLCRREAKQPPSLSFGLWSATPGGVHDPEAALHISMPLCSREATQAPRLGLVRFDARFAPPVGQRDAEARPKGHLGHKPRDHLS